MKPPLIIKTTKSWLLQAADAWTFGLGELRSIDQGVQASRYSGAAAHTQQTLVLPQSTHTPPDYLQLFSIYILSSLELRCTGVRQGVCGYPPLDLGSEKHLQMRRTQEAGSHWICILAPAHLGTFFGGHSHV